MARRKRKKPPPAGSYLTQWADMVTAMVTFMVLLFSLSKLQERKFWLGVSSIREAFSGTGAIGLLPLTSRPSRWSGHPPTHSRAMPDEEGLMLRRNMHALRGAQEGLSEPFETEMTGRGLLVTLPDGIGFDAGSTEPSDEAKAVMRRMGMALRYGENPVVIEGYATEREAGGEGSGLEALRLASMRAGAVYRYLQDVAGIPSERMQMAGHLLEPAWGNRGRVIVRIASEGPHGG